MILPFSHSPVARFCRAGLILFCVLCLTACAAGLDAGGGGELPAQREHAAFKAMILAQPEFTEAELLKFRDDLDSAFTADTPEDIILEYLEASRGWPQNRSVYMVLKMGLASESILAGKSYTDMFPAIPAELYPSAVETGLIRKHRETVVPLFAPERGRAAPDGTPGQRP